MPAIVEGTTHTRSFASAAYRRLPGTRVHMIGIGGCGMSGAAAVLHKLGALVSGSDLVLSETLRTLAVQGIRVAAQHDESHVDPRTDLVVISAAIPESNPELQAARRLGICVLKYAQLLGELMRSYTGVAVAGTHGKSTTSAMCAYLFRAGGLAPTFLIGARSDQLGGHSDVGSGPHLVVEACEYDRSFLHLTPESAAILNVEADHLDCFPHLEAIVDAFAEFARRVHPDGLLVINGSDARALQAAEKASARVQTVGLTSDVDWRAVGLRDDRGRFAFDVWRQGREWGHVQLAIPGQMHVQNALAALALADHAGVDPAVACTALGEFHGVDRRLSWRGEGNGITILDDYAHHPTEIRVTLEAARVRYAPKRMRVVFQPHQCSRTRYLMDGFAGAFDRVDEVLVPDVYGARESSAEQNTLAARELVDRINQASGLRPPVSRLRPHACDLRPPVSGLRPPASGLRPKAWYVAAFENAVEHLARDLRNGDVVLTMGAGDVWKVADELVERFCGSDRSGRATRPANLVSAGRACAVAVPAA